MNLKLGTSNLILNNPLKSGVLSSVAFSVFISIFVLLFVFNRTFRKIVIFSISTLAFFISGYTLQKQGILIATVWEGTIQTSANMSIFASNASYDIFSSLNSFINDVYNSFKDGDFLFLAEHFYAIYESSIEFAYDDLHQNIVLIVSQIKLFFALCYHFVKNILNLESTNNLDYFNNTYSFNTTTVTAKLSC